MSETNGFKIEADEAIAQIVHVLEGADVKFICEVYRKVCNDSATVTTDRQIYVPEV